ncbi:MAG TPA: penicillin-binding transpeptidase domain-containing protein [Marmoricola sp.]|jgi:cell division protein FtsI/penicillin-binding protein 2|nr:penicillin-binding transpeptidase domain-containing protein [Marmoricola sp.]
MTSRTRAGLVVVLLLALLASGCGLFGGGDSAKDEAQKAADALAQALGKGDVGTVAFTTSGAAAGYHQLVEPLAGDSSQVTAGDVRVDGSRASVALTWKTTLTPKATWAHAGTAVLRKTGSTWKVVWAPGILERSLTSAQHLSVTGLNAARANILGAGGKALVEPRPVIRFGIDKEAATAKDPGADLTTSATRLAGLLHITAAPYVKEVATAGPKAFVPALVLRRDEVPDRLIGQLESIPGARAIADELPLAPTKDFAAALLGTVGPATAEIIKKSDGRLHVGDDAGLSGLESRYDAQLAGTSGVEVKAVSGTDAASAASTVLFTAPAVAGTPLALTLDQRLQSLAQQLLTRYGPASALVAIRPSTGAVLAAASGPGSNGYNTATFGQYAPGSTFKIVSSLALLRAGLTPSTIVSCPLHVDVNGKVFKNYSDYPPGKIGRIPFRDAVANSCNTAFISSRAKVTGTAEADAAAALGFGVDHDTGFPAYFGQVPAPAGETEAAADLIGQGKVLASPLAMATVVASVVRGGTVVPDLISGLPAVTASPAKPLTPSEAASLRALMRAVVTEGSGAALASLPGPPVIAKTGTAEYGTAKNGGALPTHAWMVGAQGDLAVAVFVADGQTGSQTAGPVLKAFLAGAR